MVLPSIFQNLNDTDAFSLNNPYAKTEDEENYDILKRVTERQNAAPNVDPKDVPDPYYQPPTEVTPISAVSRLKTTWWQPSDSIQEALGMKASPTEAKPEQEPEELSLILMILPQNIRSP